MSTFRQVPSWPLLLFIIFIIKSQFFNCLRLILHKGSIKNPSSPHSGNGFVIQLEVIEEEISDPQQ